MCQMIQKHVQLTISVATVGTLIVHYTGYVHMHNSKYVQPIKHPSFMT